MSLYRLLYSILWFIVCPLVLLRLFWRSRQNPGHRMNWQRRLGFVQLKPGPRLWLHAVSVGETMAAKPLIEALLKQYPEHHLLLTNTTLTGSQTAQRLFADRVEHAYFPYDLPFAVKRFIRSANPDLLIIMETELWPNLIASCHQQNVPLMIANARLSERSSRGYARLSHLIKPALQYVSSIACRSEQDALHFKQLGAKPETVMVTGNIKFDVAAKTQTTAAPQLREQLKPNAKIWVAASTHQGEDEQILSCFQTLRTRHPELILILVPRHPERFDSVYALCNNTAFQVQRRSTHKTFTPNCDIILGDSLGEMAYWYSAADIVFVGGSLVPTGGHNPLEASIYGVPVVSGPAIFNFNDVFDILCAADIAWVEVDQDSLTKQISALLALTETERQAIHQRAEITLAQHRGVTDQLIRQASKLITPSK